MLVIAIVVAGMYGCVGPAEQVQDTPGDVDPREYTVAELSAKVRAGAVYIEASRGGSALAFGSGFVIDPEGVIITNFHVLEGADDAHVELESARYDVVSVLAASEDWDLAVIKIDARHLTALPLGVGIDAVVVGEEVMAVGNPEGLEGTVSSGIVSALRFDSDMDINLIQTTTPISKGSSGGPLLNMRGEVIGVNTYTYVRGQNLNFAVPVDQIHQLLGQVGPGETVAAVFSGGRRAPRSYEHQVGELAVILQWEGDCDLDLEIWSEDLEYLGAAFDLGDSPDISRGDQGEEWFVFRQYAETDVSRQHDLPRDFSRGRFAVSPYFFGPETEETVLAALTVIFPDGSRHELQRELSYMPPYDQWFAVLVDVDSNDVQILDLFADEGEPPTAGFYEHREGELAVVLGWAGDYDLDLEIWSEGFEYLGAAFDLGDSPDISRGDQGEEWFVFRQYPETDVSRQHDLPRDFSRGRFAASPYFFGPETEETVLAVLTVIFPDGSRHELQREMSYMPPYDQWFAVLVDVGTGDMQVLDFFGD